MSLWCESADPVTVMLTSRPVQPSVHNPVKTTKKIFLPNDNPESFRGTISTRSNAKKPMSLNRSQTCGFRQVSRGHTHTHASHVVPSYKTLANH